ncbi:MAG: DUF2784 domain-containing protein [Calditrichia bacterium]
MKIFIANFILIFHFLYVFYIIGGFLFIWTGFIFKWRSVRNRWFRWSHVAAMGFVAAEAIAGIFCPLTEWESQLRQAGGETSLYPRGFIPYWVHQVLFYDWPVWVFRAIYIGFFLLLILTILLIPPLRRDEC